MITDIKIINFPFSIINCNQQIVLFLRVMNRSFSIVPVAFIFLLLTGCGKSNQVDTFDDDIMDTHSYAKPKEARTTHLDLDIDVDFDTKIISGTARHTIENNKATEFILDTRGISVIRVTLDDSDLSVSYRQTESKEYLGSALVIPITPATQVVTVYYFTSPDAAALGWLDPVQTAGKKLPFLYTQGQAILTRSWIPIQDSPGIRFTYNATVRVPSNMMAVMSASNPTEKTEDGEYHFAMMIPVPAYLIAIAVGDIAFGSIGPRTGVYAEPSMLEASVYEFGETEQMLEIAEGLYGDYPWERYDMIVLPPSFPFGGMENPRLTFVTPTVVAGDRSLVSLIAHELAHSWSGNLVTNATWNDFWLNEGFTVYFERRIMEELYGDDYTRMLALLGKQDLENTIEDLGRESEDTHLYLNLAGRDPDDGMTDIAYEKGALFLKLLEEQVGRKKFDRFLSKYFDEHKYQSMTTQRFIPYLNKNLIEPNNLDINIDAWIYGPGLPANSPVIKSDRFDKVDQVIAQFQDNPDEIVPATKDWTSHEWIHFVRHLPEDITVAHLQTLDQTFNFASSGNSEIAAAWYEVAINSGYAPQIMDNIETFLIGVGRRKFLMQLYGAMKENSMLDKAREIYSKARQNYHTVSVQSLDKLLEL